MPAGDPARCPAGAPRRSPPLCAARCAGGRARRRSYWQHARRLNREVRGYAWAMARRTVIPLLIAVAVYAAALAPAARADGDPASDVLLAAPAFYPYSPATSAATRMRLEATEAAAQAAGYPIKVAIIAGRTDLGAAGALWTFPTRYAAFLSYEISGIVKAPILVVMPAGFGLALNGKNLPVTALASARKQVPGHTPDAMAAQAELAVRRLASDAGHPIPGKPPAAPARSGGSSTGLILGLAGFAAVLVLGVSWALELRRRRARPAA